MDSNKCHVICLPLPAHGHVRPMLTLATTLHSNFNFHVTFININHIHQSLFLQSNVPYSSTSDDDDHDHHAAPSFVFESIPDPVEDMEDIVSLIKAIFVDKKIQGHVMEALTRARARTRDGDVMFMLTDMGMISFSDDVAEEAGISVVVLETSGACSMLACFNLQELINKGLIPLKDTSYLTNGYLEKKIDWIPSLMGITLKDMPTFVRTTNTNDMMLNIIVSSIPNKVLKSKAILVNTFDALDLHILNDLSKFSSNIYSIGPIHLLEAQEINNGDTNKEYYMQWLDSQESNSILYVSFGTIVVATQDQLVEFAWGLANSNQKFLWVVRSSFKMDQPDSPLNEFEKAIEGRGLLVSWCDQRKVLAHPSTGGFLTHCGWNSTIESISYGVPMICWPGAIDQVTNCWYCCYSLGIGIKMNEEVKREEVERVVREMMEGKSGKEMKKKVMEWSKLAQEATIIPHGSSYHNLKYVIDNLIHLNK